MPSNIRGLEPNTDYSTQKLDSDSTIVSCETIMQIKEGVTSCRPLDGYCDRVTVWYLVIIAARVEISAITYSIIISKTEVNFTLQSPYPFKRKFQVHVFMEFAVYLSR